MYLLINCFTPFQNEVDSKGKSFKVLLIITTLLPSIPSQLRNLSHTQYSRDTQQIKTTPY